LKAPKNSKQEKDSMIFDELWRMNLAEEKTRLDSTSNAKTTDEESQNELELTDEDRTFLSQVGIEP
jgi:hypothetical protein